MRRTTPLSRALRVLRRRAAARSVVLSSCSCAVWRAADDGRSGARAISLGGAPLLRSARRVGRRRLRGRRRCRRRRRWIISSRWGNNTMQMRIVVGFEISRVEFQKVYDRLDVHLTECVLVPPPRAARSRALLRSPRFGWSDPDRPPARPASRRATFARVTGPRATLSRTQASSQVDRWIDRSSPIDRTNEPGTRREGQRWGPNAAPSLSPLASRLAGCPSSPLACGVACRVAFASPGCHQLCHSLVPSDRLVTAHARTGSASCHSLTVPSSDVVTTHRFGESYYNPMIPPVLKELQGKGMVNNDSGAECVFLPNRQVRTVGRATEM